MLFSTEAFGISQCLSINGRNFHHGTKSNILQRFKPTEFPGNETSTAIIIELIAIIIISKYLYKANSSVVILYTKLYAIYTLLSWRPCKT